MQTAPIALFGNSAILTTNAGASTNTSVPVLLSALGFVNFQNPPQIRLLNKGTADIWLNFTNPAAVPAVIPVAGTTTLGTPSPVIWLAPGIEITLTLPVSIAPMTGVTGVTGAAATGFWMSNISTGTSQSFQFQLGDGQ